jgi:hypothetical protein
MFGIIIVTLVVAAGCVAYFFFGRSSEQAAGHRDDDRHGSGRFIGDNQAPAGPGAEDQFVSSSGQAAPGPTDRHPSRIR